MGDVNPGGPDDPCADWRKSVKEAQEESDWAEKFLATAKGRYGDPATVPYYEYLAWLRRWKLRDVQRGLRDCEQQHMNDPKPEPPKPKAPPPGGEQPPNLTDPHAPPPSPGVEGPWWTWEHKGPGMEGKWVKTTEPEVTVPRCLEGTWHLVTYEIVVIFLGWTYGAELADVDLRIPCTSTGPDGYPPRIIHQVSPPPKEGPKIMKDERALGPSPESHTAAPAVKTRVVTRYDEEGRVIGRTTTEDDGKGNSVTKDETGKVIGKTTTTDDGKGTVTSITTDDTQNVITKTVTTDDGKGHTSSTTTHYDNQSRESGKTVTTSDGKTTRSVTTDAQAHVVEESESTTDDEGTITTIFKDGTGNTTAKTVSKNDGKGNVTTTFYDKDGNLTGRVFLARHECIKGTWHRVTYNITDPNHWIKLEDVDDGQPCPQAKISQVLPDTGATTTSRVPLIAGAVAAVVVAGGIAAYALFGRGGTTSTNATTTQQSSQAAQATPSPPVLQSPTPAAVAHTVSIDPQPNPAQGFFSNGRGTCGNAPSQFQDVFQISILNTLSGGQHLRIDQPSTGDTSQGPFSSDFRSVETRGVADHYVLQIGGPTRLQGTYEQILPNLDCTWDVRFILQGTGLIVH